MGKHNAQPAKPFAHATALHTAVSVEVNMRAAQKVLQQIQYSSNKCTIIILNVFTLQYLHADRTCFDPSWDHLQGFTQI
jgi:hypothetical protein